MTVQPDSRGEDQTRISVVHALFKTHLDIGFTNRAHGNKDSLRNNFPPLCRLRRLDATAKTGS